MALVVQKEFHQPGTGKFQTRGTVLTTAEQSEVENRPELLARCLRHPGIVPPDVLNASAAAPAAAPAKDVAQSTQAMSDAPSASSSKADRQKVDAK